MERNAYARKAFAWPMVPKVCFSMILRRFAEETIRLAIACQVAP
jgi:hypothetical protein